MPAFGHTVRRHAHEWTVCLRRGATWRDRLRLLRDTVRFHLGNRLRAGVPATDAFDPPTTYRILVAGRPIDVQLRRRSGDLFVFHEVLGDDAYRLPPALAPSVSTIIDAGAHVGLSTLALLEQCPHAQVLCVEPNAANVPLLRGNLRAYADRTQVVTGALLDRSGPADLVRGGHSWAGRVVSRAESDAARSGDSGAVSRTEEATAVRGYTLADVMAQAGFSDLDLLKLDIEGSEAGILGSATSPLQQVGMIIAELHEPYSIERFWADLVPRGFRLLPPGGPAGNQLPMAVALSRLSA